MIFSYFFIVQSDFVNISINTCVVLYLELKYNHFKLLCDCSGIRKRRLHLVRMAASLLKAAKSPRLSGK